VEYRFILFKSQRSPQNQYLSGRRASLCYYRRKINPIGQLSAVFINDWKLNRLFPRFDVSQWDLADFEEGVGKEH